MKQAVMTEPGAIELREVRTPSAGPGEVLLRVRRIGVCGSDVHVWRGEHPYTSYPVVQGHEIAGVVEQVGAGVEGVEPGRKATCLPQIVCGRCGPCRRGDWHICENLKVRGFQAPGAAQEWFLAPAERVVPLPEEMTLEQGAMVEPVAVAVHSVARAGAVAGRRGVVLGAGPIGNLVAQVASAEGAEVLITDVAEERRRIAARCGVERTSDAGRENLADAVSRLLGPDGFDLAWDCAGAEETIGAAIANITKGGVIVIVAVFAEHPRVNLGFVQDRELNLLGTLMYQRADYERAIELIADGRVRLEPLMGRHFALSEYAEAYRAIERGKGEVMKAFIDL